MAKVGYCNICGRHRPLTADHVPPKGSGGLSDAELKTLSRYLLLDAHRPKIYQNGVKFPTLCGDCNNTRRRGALRPGRQMQPSNPALHNKGSPGFLKRTDAQVSLSHPPFI